MDDRFLNISKFIYKSRIFQVTKARVAMLQNFKKTKMNLFSLLLLTTKKTFIFNKFGN